MQDTIEDAAVEVIRQYGPMTTSQVRNKIEEHYPEVLESVKVTSKEGEPAESTIHFSQEVVLHKLLGDDIRFAEDDSGRFVLTDATS